MSRRKDAVTLACVKLTISVRNKSNQKPNNIHKGENFLNSVDDSVDLVTELMLYISFHVLLISLDGGEGEPGSMAFIYS